MSCVCRSTGAERRPHRKALSKRCSASTIAKATTRPGTCRNGKVANRSLLSGAPGKHWEAPWKDPLGRDGFRKDLIEGRETRKVQRHEDLQEHRDSRGWPCRRGDSRRPDVRPCHGFT